MNIITRGSLTIGLISLGAAAFATPKITDVPTSSEPMHVKTIKTTQDKTLSFHCPDPEKGELKWAHNPAIIGYKYLAIPQSQEGETWNVLGYKRDNPPPPIPVWEAAELRTYTNSVFHLTCLYKVGDQNFPLAAKIFLPDATCQLNDRTVTCTTHINTKG